MADPTPSDLAKDLREGKITYQQYQDGIAAYNAAPTPAADVGSPTDPNDVKAALAAQMSQRANVHTGNAAIGQPTAPPGPAPEPPTLNAGSFTIGAPPVGAAQMQGGPALPPAMTPNQAVEAQFLQRRGGPAHPIGNSPAEKAHIAELGQRGAGYGAITDQATQDIDQARADMAQQNWILDQQTRLAADMHAQGMQRDADRRKQIEAEHKERSSKISAQLADLDAREINPNAYWQNRSTPAKFAGALAVAFSAFGSQYGKGGTNTALDIFSHAVDQEIDAQRANLTKSLSVAKSRMELAGSDWDHDVALLKAERDSTETAYQVAMRQVDSTAARYKDNALFQAKAAEIKAGLLTQNQDKIGAINDQIFATLKRGETPVGGGVDVAKLQDQLVKRTMELRNTHPEITPEQARDEAAREMGLAAPGGGPEAQRTSKKPEEIAKSTVLVNGQPMQAVNEEQAKSFAKFQEAFPEQQRLLRELQKAWKDQDWATYQTSRAAYIENAPRVYGFTRGPSGAQAGEGSHDDAAIKGTVSGQLPDMGVWLNQRQFIGPAGHERGTTMLNNVGTHLSSIYDNMWRSTFTAPSPGNPLGLQRR